MKDKYFLRTIVWSPLFFIPMIVIIVSVQSMRIHIQTFEDNIKELEKDLLHEEIKAAEAKVLSIADLIAYQKSIIKNDLKQRVKKRVDNADKVAEAIYVKYKDTKSEEEIKEIIITTLRAMTWNDGESFIWILDFQGVFQLAPSYLRHLEGKSIIDLQDNAGRYVIREEIAICKDKGEGFIWDTFTKPNENNSTKQYEQVAFVKAFGHFNWYLGDSEYLDTATKKTDRELLESINKVNRSGDNYMFIVKTNGDVLLNSSIPEAENMNLFQTDDPRAIKIATKIMNALKNRDSALLTYEWINPSTQKIEKKYSYIKKIPNSDWIVGSGFYLSDIQSKVAEQKINLYEVYNKQWMKIVYTYLILVVLSLLISYFISGRIKKSFHLYEEHICDKNLELLELNENLEDKVKERTTELERMKDDLEMLASTDMLTNIYNRYALMKAFATEVNRSNRYHSPLSVIMYDIDMFKHVNDEFGHDVGDRVLTSISDLIKKNLRDIDIIGRYGGEEFLIILPNTTIDDAKHFAERLRKEVENYSFDPVGSITISLGLVEHRQDESVDAMFKRLDELLYTSKNSGRNTLSF